MLRIDTMGRLSTMLHRAVLASLSGMGHNTSASVRQSSLYCMHMCSACSYIAEECMRAFAHASAYHTQLCSSGYNPLCLHTQLFTKLVTL